MKWLTYKVQQEPGFRLNLIDLAMLAALGVATWLLHRFATDSGLFWLPLYVGESFFLFCNVFRIGNRSEAIWWMTFLTLAAGTIVVHYQWFWYVILPVCEPLKIGLILYSMRWGTYRGMLAHRLPRTPAPAPRT